MANGNREFISSPVIDEELDTGIGLTLPFNSETGKFGEVSYFSIDQALSLSLIHI